ncbi:MAG: response regulator [Burkholderiales bacterium]
MPSPRLRRQTSEVGDGDAALREADRLHLALVLMDIKMPGPGPVETIRRLKQSVADVQVLVFTSYVEDCQVLDKFGVADRTQAALLAHKEGVMR